MDPAVAHDNVVTPLASLPANQVEPVSAARLQEASHAATEWRRLRDGALVSVADDRVEVRDGEGRLLISYADGHALIEAPGGDLRLRAPRGSVTLEAHEDVTVRAAGTLRQDSARMEVHCRTLIANAVHSELVGEGARMVVDRLTTTAAWVSHRAERYELEAERLVERTRDSFRETRELWQLRAGTMRQLVNGVFRLRSDRASLVSNKETSIDGSKVLLG